jgi:predicted acyl esterase
MKRLLMLWSVLLMSIPAISQVIPNGTIDGLDELYEKQTRDIKMFDSTTLKMDMYVPVIQDSLVSIINIPGTGDVTIQLMSKNTQYLIYDSIDNQVNPNPYQLPLVFTRTPYNKNGDELGPLFAFFGYAYGTQDMRGANASSGVYFPMYSDGWNKNPYHPYINYNIDITSPSDPRNANKHEDGYQTLHRLLNDVERVYDYDGDQQADTFLVTNGSVGMIGASALGNSQYSLAAAHPVNSSQSGLQSIMPIVASADHYSSTLTNNGVYREALVDNWITGQVYSLVDDSLNTTDTSIMNNLHSSSDYNLSNKADVAKNAIDFLLVENSKPGYYPDSPLRSAMDVSYAPVDAAGNPDSTGNFSRFRNMDVPAYHLTGWWDIFIDGQIHSFNRMKEEALSQQTHDLQKLIIGPWAHQTIGSRSTGDVQYPENVTDVIGLNTIYDNFSLSDSSSISEIMDSELLNWFRYTINKKGVPETGKPKFIIPESDQWQPIDSTTSVRVPSEDYIKPYYMFIQYLAGQTTLDNLPVEIQTQNDTIPYSYTLPVLDPPLMPLQDTVEDKPITDFQNIPSVRLYIAGPVNDGIPENDNAGNYWMECDSFPFEQGINHTNFYLHGDSTIDQQMPTEDEGSHSYIHDPDDPVITVGGANMTINTPEGPQRRAQGQMNLADSLFVNYTMDNQGVIQFTSGQIQDSLRILGFPEATIYARSEVTGIGKTDTDFFVRILDVYPDGREMFVVEGCVNARAREYARSIYNGNEDVNLPYTNIESDSIYEYKFKMLPIGYVWGKDHKIKILISSGNYPRYQSNPNLPLMDYDFFRRKPNDGQTYNYQGNDMSPRVAMQKVYFSPEYPSHIQLPVFDNLPVGMEDSPKSDDNVKWSIYPNPADDYLYVELPEEEGVLSLYSVNGQLLDKKNTRGSETLNLQSHSAGIYLLKYNSPNHVFNEKLIIRR